MEVTGFGPALQEGVLEAIRNEEQRGKKSAVNGAWELARARRTILGEKILDGTNGWLSETPQGRGTGRAPRGEGARKMEEVLGEEAAE